MAGNRVRRARVPGRRFGVITLGVACAALLLATTASRRAPEAPAPGDLPAAAPSRMYNVPRDPAIAGMERGTFTPLASGDARTIAFSNGIRIDTRAGEPALDADLTLRSYGAGRDGYYLVQFDGPVQPAWKSAIESAGGRVLYYLPEYAFVVRMPESVRASVAGDAHVAWTGLYQPAYKLSEGLLHAPAAATGPETVNILLFANESRATVESAVHAAGGTIRLSFDGHVSIVRAELDRAGVNAMARLPEVAWIEPYVPNVPLNDQCQWVVQTNTSGVRKIWDNGITGTGQVLNSADTGIYTDHNAFRDPAVPITTWGDYPTHRKVIAYVNPGNSPDVGFGEGGGHGSHTAGTLVGNDAPFGTAPYDGMAKDAKIYFCDIGTPSGSLAIATDHYTFYG
jgi:hypothetical protein